MSYTALQMVNRVQRKMRLPLSAAVTAYHAALILEDINTVQRDLMLDGYVWDELKLLGYFETDATNYIYTLSGSTGQDVDVIRNMEIAGYDPLVKLPDEIFRQMKRSLGTTKNRPLYYRHHSRSDGDLRIELSPTPDAIYQIDTEILMKPSILTADSDLIILDSDAVFLGTLMLARKEQGQDIVTDLAVFQSKLAMLSGSNNDSNLGDVECV